MQKNYKHILLILVCLILAVSFLWHHRNPQASSGEPLSQNHTKIQSAVTNISTAQSASNVVKQTASIVPSPTNRVEMLKRALESKNVPIDFYGRVVDQDSNSLSDVKIKVSVRHWQMTASDLSRTIPIERRTDVNGRFKIDGATGDAFDIEYVQKAGYEIEPTKNSFGSSAGSFENPVVFKMWRSDIKEPLVAGAKFFKLVSDGQNYIIDFIKGEIFLESRGAEGDLSVWINKTEPKVGQKYDWSFSIQADSGGLYEESNPYSAMYLAPDGNYTNTFNGSFFASDQHWGNAIAGKRFYINTRNGKMYGRIEIEVYPSYGNTGEGRFWIKYAVNPTGSRILR
jgi:hypothetical protein